jgi:hypothetical protein
MKCGLLALDVTEMWQGWEPKELSMTTSPNNIAKKRTNPNENLHRHRYFCRMSFPPNEKV